MKKKILILTDWFDPAYKAGGPIRSCVNFVMNMREEYELFVFTGDRDLGMQAPLPGVRINEWHKHNDGARVFYASPDKLNFAGIREVIKDIQPHFIYLNSFFSRCFTVYPLLINRFYKIDAITVLAPRGMLKASALQFKSTKKKIFLWIIKIMGLLDKIRFHATDEEEEKDIRHQFPQNEVLMAPNFPGIVAPQNEVLDKQQGQLSVIFIGRIHPIKNLDFLLKVLEQVKGMIQLTIIGVMEQLPYWSYCEDLIKKLPPTVQVNYEGEVPHQQLATIISKHHIFALPTQGENFGHAIFDALSVGKPVLISDQTPWRNLRQQEAGWDLDLRQPVLFKQALQEAVDWNSQTYDQWSEAAYKLAARFAEQSGLKEKYKKIFS